MAALLRYAPPRCSPCLHRISINDDLLRSRFVGCIDTVLTVLISIGDKNLADSMNAHMTGMRRELLLTMSVANVSSQQFFLRSSFTSQKMVL